MPVWTDESREALKKAYLAQNPTPENSMEILASIVPDFKATVNGARIILKDVFVKKEPVTSSSKDTKEKKETKAESLDRLTKSIEAQGLEADDTIISKLTGKAGAYFADIITKSNAEDED